MSPASHLTAFCLLFLGVVTTQAEERVEILRVGLHHGDEVNVEPGPDWWGIFPDGEEFTLQPAPVTFSIEHDAIVDEEGQATGKMIRVPQESEPVLLVRGVTGLREGRLAPLHHQPRHKFLFPGETFWLLAKESGPKFGLSLAALGTTEENGTTPEPYVNNYTLKLYAGSHPIVSSQVLHTVERVYQEARPTIVWAGDLDRDGRVDLLLNLSDHYNVSHLALFLTGAAKEGELIAKVAEWRTTGC